MTIKEMQEVVAECTYPSYSIYVALDGRGETYLQASYMEEDTETGKPELQRTRRWLLSPEMTVSEVTQTCFKAIFTSAEHRVREWFRYRGRSVYSPHFDVDALWDLCEEGVFDRRIRFGVE